MSLLIAAVGQRMPTWVDDAFQDYAKRMPEHWRITLKEIKPEPRTSGKTTTALLAAEASRLREAIPKDSYWVALDERGRDITTMQVAEQLKAWQLDNLNVVFIIGGADGLAPDIKHAARIQWRLSSMTLPHGLVRVMLVEQLYRAWSLLQGHPYHRV